MSKLIEISNEIKNYPTIMCIKDEIYFIEKLPTVTFKEINRDIELFNDIIKDLDISHTGGAIFEVTKENLPLIKKFSNWLMEISSYLNKSEYEIVAENFSEPFEL